MTEDSYANLPGESEFDSGMSLVTNSDKSIVGESCSQACMVHWPLRLLSIAIVAGGMALYELLEFAPEITILIPESMISVVGLDSGQHPLFIDG